MNTFTIIILVTCVIVIIGFLIYYFNSKRVIIRILSKIPNKPNASLKTNELSKVSGKVLHVKEFLEAPYSGRKYVFYQMKIQKKVSNGNNSY